MRKIYGIGETVFDIIFKNGQPQAAKPGGAMLNSSVSLGRIGLPVSFISEYGKDDVGNLIDEFLNINGVGTTFVHHFTGGKTGLALAFLNERNDASYTFYKNYPEKRLDIEFPVLNEDDIVLCGSIYAITQEIRGKFTAFTKSAKENKAILIYDPNFRPTHSSDLDMLVPVIIENMKTAAIIRGSDEDFKNIFNAGNADEAWRVVSRYCNCLVYTASSEGVYVRTVGYSGKFEVKKITPVSTIGAGDNFNAGMIAAIYKNNISRDHLETIGKEQWGKIVGMGVNFATEVCLSYENYISREFAEKLKN
ncbi:MAG: PfkB family carbohydrate kinase [Bacteroidota bacterium]|nr:PfkB family carbohydrate kinase [Bacteroidota bacterium]